MHALAQFLTRAEINGVAGIYFHRAAIFGVAGRAGFALTDGKGAEAPKLHPVSTAKRRGDFIENNVYENFHIPLIEVRVTFAEALDKF